MSDLGNKAPALTLDEQRMGLDYFLDCMVEVRRRSPTTRDINRAVYLGAKMLGVRYERLQRMMKIAATKGSAAAVHDAPNEIAGLIGEGYVYVASDDVGQRVKIGFSTAPAVRIQAVSAASGVSLRSVVQWPGYPIHEHICHLYCRPAWLGGEWYDADHFCRIEGFEPLRPAIAASGLKHCHACSRLIADQSEEAA